MISRYVPQTSRPSVSTHGMYHVLLGPSRPNIINGTIPRSEIFDVLEKNQLEYAVVEQVPP